ncbi:MAG: glycosyltransferase [Bacteroidia bacterium]|jgi:glycosyltransferase involved in cell wall biosynthesis|nr:glycosyltransferase [Bacteroidia bacterium]
MIEIVLPCYNPPPLWYKELISFDGFIHTQHAVSYIIVNDGSNNGELENALPLLKKANINFTLISYKDNKGKGYALRQGISASKSNCLLYTDIDFPFINESVAGMIALLLTNKYDVLAGSRNQAYYSNKMSFFRKLLSKAFRFFLKVVLRMQVTDTQCGIKAFNEKGKDEFLKTKINRYLFDFEFLYNCRKKSALKVKAVPVELKPNVVFRKMKLKILLQETLNLLKVIFTP